MLAHIHRAILAACVLSLASCAARSARVTPAAGIARADQLVVDGCYRCLQEALAIYEQQLQRTRRPLPAIRQGAFETAILVALREKELGIPFAAALTKARVFATGLTPQSGHPSAQVLADLADLAAMETSGFDPDEVAAHNTRERRLQASALRPQLEGSAIASTLETYLALSLDCNDAAAPRQLNIEHLQRQHGHVALLRYRLAACGFGPRQAFSAMRDADARWVEMRFFEGRAAGSGPRPNLRAATDSFSAARAALPQSAAIVLALAHAERGYGDLEPALATYDDVIRMVPRNREALLGRAITLSYLERHQEVIETTTQMIAMGTWLMGDAYYWRARSRFVLKALDEAWSDAEHAITLAPNTSVYTLAGVIAYDRKELPVAKDRFQRARAADATNCTAQSYFALVSAAQNNWGEAAPVFSLAMTCFLDAAAAATKERAQIEASDFDPVFKARLVRQQQTTIDESHLKAAQAAYNAAQGLLREGKRAEARDHLQRALDHPDVREQAEALQKLLGQ